MSILSKYHQFDLQNISKIRSLLTTTHCYHSNSSYRPSLWAISPQQRGIPPKPKSDIVIPCSDPSKVLMTLYKAPLNLASISLWPHFFYSLCFSDPGFLAIYFSNTPGLLLPRAFDLVVKAEMRVPPDTGMVFSFTSLGSLLRCSLSVRPSMAPHTPSLKSNTPFFLLFFVFLHSSFTV